jgi:energy-coupling factor transport system ATP-binding protein
MAESSIEFNRVSFTYPNCRIPALFDLSFAIERGDFVLLTGPTGCGKSTLLKIINGIIPHLSKGILDGSVIVSGIDSRTTDMSGLTCNVGLVFQNPNDQIVCNTVEEEIAFGLENLGIDDSEKIKRINWACEQVSVSDLLGRDPNTLSGGQKQRVVIASQIVMKPQILVFDEPLSSLDPMGAKEVMECIGNLSRLGITIVMVEHRISLVVPHCSHIMIMNKGKIVWYGERNNTFMNKYNLFEQYGIEIPDEIKLCRNLRCPELTFDADRLTYYVKNNTDFICKINSESEIFRNKKAKVDTKKFTSIEIKNVSFGYNKSNNVLQDFSLQINRGEKVAFMGINGTGKSTLLSLISGLYKPVKGNILINGIDSFSIPLKKRSTLLGYLIQNPDLMLFCDTVYSELAFGPKHISKRIQIENEVNKILEQFHLMHQRDLPPFTLSMGQRLRTALGAIITLKPRILLLDEPSTGQNQENISRLMKMLSTLDFVDNILFCTHDFSIAAEYANRIVILDKGKIISDGTPMEIFSQPDKLQSAGLQIPLITRIAMSLDLPFEMHLPYYFCKLLTTLSCDCLT